MIDLLMSVPVPYATIDLIHHFNALLEVRDSVQLIQWVKAASWPARVVFFAGGYGVLHLAWFFVRFLFEDRS